jgi:hypothetical protein
MFARGTMVRFWPVLALALSGCEPDWVEDCGCDPGAICRVADDDTAQCLPVPLACGGVFVEDCDGVDVSDSCLRELCGAPVSNWSQCFSDDEDTHFLLVCR